MQGTSDGDVALHVIEPIGADVWIQDPGFAPEREKHVQRALVAERGVLGAFLSNAEGVHGTRGLDHQ